MENILSSLIGLTIGGTFLILAAFIIRTLFKRIPGIFMYLIWIIVFINLVCPFSFKVPYEGRSDIFNIQTISSEKTDVQNENSIELSDQAYNETVDKPFIYEHIFEAVWLCGTAVILLINIFKIYSLKNKLRFSENLYDNVYENKNISIPFVTGWVSPKIYIPSNIDESEKEYIVLHEKIHIKHKDNYIKTAAYIILAIHWFNPFVWAAYTMFSEDIERFCDESVIKILGKEIKKNYSFTLLKMASDKSVFDSAVLEFGENATKRRISNVLNYKKPTFIVTAAAASALLFVGCGAFLTPTSTDESVKIESIVPSGFVELECEIPFNTDFSTDTYDFSVSLPEEAAEYCTLEYYDDSYPICLIKFTKGENVGNIGMFSFFSEEEYDAMDPSQMPVPTEVFRKDGIVIAFNGVQDSVFEIGTEEAKIVENYHSAVSEVLKTVEFSKIN